MNQTELENENLPTLLKAADRLARVLWNGARAGRSKKQLLATMTEQLRSLRARCPSCQALWRVVLLTQLRLSHGSAPSQWQLVPGAQLTCSLRLIQGPGVEIRRLPCRGRREYMSLSISRDAAECFRVDKVNGTSHTALFWLVCTVVMLGVKRAPGGWPAF